MTIREINFDGIVGPTHHYGGLGIGNIASRKHNGQTANPKTAALQGLDKMALLHSLGCLQAVLPPHPRPNINLLRNCGFTGSDADVVAAAATAEPRLLSAAYSASSMWAANAATVSRIGGKTHFSPANLVSSLHRSIEPSVTTDQLRKIFFDTQHFTVHKPLVSTIAFRDEGAANHMRLCDPTGNENWEVFVYGNDGLASEQFAKYPARQSFAACRAIARRHRLPAERTIFLQQHPDAISAGAFHNDVVATSCENVLLYHSMAFIEAERAIARLSADFEAKTGYSFCQIKVTSDEMSLKDAIASYLFNSQIVRPHNDPDHAMTLVCPAQCEENPKVAAVIERIIKDKSNPIEVVKFVELRQSMNNGGGPACLRLRVPVGTNQIAGIKHSVMWSPRLEEQLRDWVTKFYPSELTINDLADPDVIGKTTIAMQQLSRILDLQFVA